MSLQDECNRQRKKIVRDIDDALDDRLFDGAHRLFDHEKECLVAVVLGDFDRLKALLGSTGRLGTWDTYDYLMCDFAAQHGHLAILEWLRTQSPPCPWTASMACVAVKHGQWDILKWARQQSPPCPWHEGTFACAATTGHLPLMQWLKTEHCPWGAMSCTQAAKMADIETLQWLRHQEPPCPWNEGTSFAAAQEGDGATLQWLRAQGCPWNETEICATIADRYGDDWETLQWLQRQVSPKTWNLDRLCQNALAARNWQIFRWLVTQGELDCKAWYVPHGVRLSYQAHQWLSLRNPFVYDTAREQWVTARGPILNFYKQPIRQWFETLDHVFETVLAHVLCHDVVGLVQQYC